MRRQFSLAPLGPRFGEATEPRQSRVRMLQISRETHECVPYAKRQYESPYDSERRERLTRDYRKPHEADTKHDKPQT